MTQWSSVISKDLTKGGRRAKIWEEAMMMKAEVQVTRGHELQNASRLWPVEGTKKDPPLGLQKKCRPPDTFMLTLQAGFDF